MYHVNSLLVTVAEAVVFYAVFVSLFFFVARVMCQGIFLFAILHWLTVDGAWLYKICHVAMILLI